MAFGVSNNPFQGTMDNPFYGLAQGSGFTPPTFQAVSTHMINSYKLMGNGYTYVSPVTLTIFAFAAILYVDHTDLLMRALPPTTPDTTFFDMIQKSLSDWAALVIATGGSIKQKKSYVRINLYCF